ncbi:MAG: hypothetical protein JJT78_12130 [Leptospira sp.]|nr:hypothetical protein [Leptospira sp.]
MFYLLLSLLHEEYASGRMDFSTYQENIILISEDYQRLKSALKNEAKAA